MLWSSCARGGLWGQYILSALNFAYNTGIQLSCHVPKPWPWWKF